MHAFQGARGGADPLRPRRLHAARTRRARRRPRAAGDACGAEALQPLVGTSVGTLDPATLPEPNRVLFPGQAATTDFQDERLNVEIGADDRVARVFCG